MWSSASGSSPTSCLHTHTTDNRRRFNRDRVNLAAGEGFPYTWFLTHLLPADTQQQKAAQHRLCQSSNGRKLICTWLFAHFMPAEHAACRQCSTTYCVNQGQAATLSAVTKKHQHTYLPLHLLHSCRRKFFTQLDPRPPLPTTPRPPVVCNVIVLIVRLSILCLLPPLLTLLELLLTPPLAPRCCCCCSCWVLGCLGLVCCCLKVSMAPLLSLQSQQQCTHNLSSIKPVAQAATGQYTAAVVKKKGHKPNRHR